MLRANRGKDIPILRPFWDIDRTKQPDQYLCRPTITEQPTNFAGFVAVNSTNLQTPILPSPTPPEYNKLNLVSTPGIPFGTNLKAPSFLLTRSSSSFPGMVGGVGSPSMDWGCSRIPLGLPCGWSYRNGQWSEEKIVNDPLWRPLCQLMFSIEGEWGWGDVHV